MKVKVMQGDCLEIMKEIPDGSVDMVLADPPYGTTACKWDSIIPFEPMWEQLKRVIKPNGAIVLFGSEPFSSALRMSNIKNYKYDWVWDKVRPVGVHVSKYRPLAKCENISVFGKGKLTYNRQMEKREKPRKGSREYGRTSVIGGKMNKEWNEQKRVYTEKNPTTLLTFSNASNKGRLHPTQKPVALMEYLIKTYTNEGETVLDFTMGSGTTGVAAKNLNRKFIGIELDPDYFQIAKDRIDAVTPQLCD